MARLWRKRQPYLTKQAHEAYIQSCCTPEQLAIYREIKYFDWQCSKVQEIEPGGQYVLWCYHSGILVPNAITLRARHAHLFPDGKFIRYDPTRIG